MSDGDATQLGTATWREVDRVPRRLLLVPLGACEQHGPHLPLDTDTRIACAVADRAAAGRAGVAVAPAVAIGASGEHAAFPGTLSIGTEALELLLVELGRDAARHWESIMYVNAHGGNVAAVTAAVAQLAGEGRRCAAHHVSVPDGDAHAGHVETSLLLHLAPELVRLAPGEPAPIGATEPIAELLPRLRDEGVRAVSANGVLGDARGASAAEGRRLLAELVRACAAHVDAMLGVGA